MATTGFRAFSVLTLFPAAVASTGARAFGVLTLFPSQKTLLSATPGVLQELKTGIREN